MGLLNLACHCGQVRIAVTRRPDFLHECNCSLCSKAGARWGYFYPDEVEIDGATNSFCRTDKATPNVNVHFCPECGVTTHFTLTEAAIAKFGNRTRGVNMGLAAAEDLEGIELRFPDGRAWSGEGAFGYVREAVILG